MSIQADSLFIKNETTPISGLALRHGRQSFFFQFSECCYLKQTLLAKEAFFGLLNLYFFYSAQSGKIKNGMATC